MSTKTVSPANEHLTAVLNRVAEVVHATKETGVAKALGVSPSTLSTWRSRGTMPYEQLLQFADEKSLNIFWLLHGRPPMQSDSPAGVVSAEEARSSYSIDLSLMRSVVEAATTLFEEQQLRLPPAKFAELVMLAYELERAAAQRDPRARVQQLLKLAA